MLEVVVYVLTALAAAVVALTRLRLARPGGAAGSVHVGSGLVNAHTIAGTVALVLWLAFLLADETTSLGSETTGILALACWWAVAVAGLLVLVRWLPSRGRHASAGRSDAWSAGPGLSILAHVGMLAGVCVFTYAYLVSAV